VAKQLDFGKLFVCTNALQASISL